jgi:hypothetical protein
LAERLRYIRYRKEESWPEEAFLNLNDVETTDGILREKEFP